MFDILKSVVMSAPFAFLAGVIIVNFIWKFIERKHKKAVYHLTQADRLWEERREMVIKAGKYWDYSSEQEYQEKLAIQIYHYEEYLRLSPRAEIEDKRHLNKLLDELK